jgi:hypothetical protein
MTQAFHLAQFHHPPCQQSQAPAALAGGMLTTGQRQQVGFLFAIQFAQGWPFWLRPPDHRIEHTTFDKAFAHSFHCRRADFQGFTDALIAPAWPLFSLVSFQQDPGMSLAAR